MLSSILELSSLQVSLCSLIRSFFQTLTHDEVLLLLSGTMDANTRPLLLELISSIIHNLSTALQAHVMEMDAELSEQLVVSCLGNVVANSFKAALDVNARGQSRSAETLRDMISQEVMVSVQCSMSDNLRKHVPAPKRLDRMLKLAAKMLKWLKKKLFTTSTNGEEIEPEEPTTSGQHLNYLYGVENMEDDSADDSAEDPEEVSLKSKQNNCRCNPSSVVLVHASHNSYCIDDMEEKIETPVLKAKAQKKCRFCDDQGSDNSAGSMEFIIAPSIEEKEVVSSPAPPDPLLEDIRKNGVFLVVERLVSLTYSKNNVRRYLTDPTSIIERLMARTWAAVEDVDFEYSPQIVANLEKTIFKDLVKKWGGKEMVLTNMKLGSSALEEFVANAVKACLTAQPEERSSVRRFFSSVGQAIANIGERARHVLRATCERWGKLESP